MNKIAFIFPGQGAQSTGMGLDLFENFASAKNVFSKADMVLKKNVSKMCFEGPDEVLKLTTNTQSCLLAVSIAALEAFKEVSGGKIKADYALGHSLGEYSAMYASGVMDLDNILLAIQKRADLMQEACESSKAGAMSAILGLSEEKIKECIKQASSKGLVSIANYNEPNQIVITGEKDAVDYANDLIKEAGAKRVVPLAVSGGFHSELMRSAGEKFKDFLTTLKINNANIPVVTNVDSELTLNAEDFIKKMPEQIYSSVYWMQSIKKLLELGVDTFVEFGNGKVLSGSNRKICPPDVKTYNVSDAASLRLTLEALSA